MDHVPEVDRAPEADTGAAMRLGFLRSNAAYAALAGAAASVEVIETHMSWVFLVGEHAFKLKKPVRYPSLDFSTVAARETSCREELRLNSRLAPGVYRGLMALQWRDDGLALVPEPQGHAPGRTLDWLVWMRRLPADRMLDRLIAQGRVELAQIDELAAVLVAFYRHAKRIEIDAADHWAQCQREQAINREVLLRPQFQLQGAAQALDALDRALQGGRAVLATRVAQRRIVDGHGDLRPEHVCLLQPPVVIDSLEFNAKLRQIDPLDELAFMALECHVAGAPSIGTRLLGTCVALLGDVPPPCLLPLYTASRALLRARLAMSHLLDLQPRTPQRWPPLAQRYIAHCLQTLSAAGTSRGSP